METAHSSSGETFGADSDKPGAMVCHTEPAKFKALLESMGFAVHTPTSHDEAINNLRLNNYRLVLVTLDYFNAPRGHSTIMEHLQDMTMATRRKLFVAYVIQGAHSYDNLEAFTNSVNLIVSPDDATKENFKEHISRGMKANDMLYKVYFECMAAAGKI